MAQFSATWTGTVVADVEAGDHPTVELWQLFGQNIEHLGQNHDHGGDTPDGSDPGLTDDGGQLALKLPITILYWIGSTH